MSQRGGPSGTSMDEAAAVTVDGVDGVVGDARVREAIVEKGVGRRHGGSVPGAQGDAHDLVRSRGSIV